MKLLRESLYKTSNISDPRCPSIDVYLSIATAILSGIAHAFRLALTCYPGYGVVNRIRPRLANGHVFSFLYMRLKDIGNTRSLIWKLLDYVNIGRIKLHMKNWRIRCFCSAINFKISAIYYNIMWMLHEIYNLSIATFICLFFYHWGT